MQKQKVVIIGAGIAALSASALLANKGYEVEIYEKNDQPGGKARVFSDNGFTFDMGPSWYMMPEVFDDFFELLGKNREDYYKLERLDPSYKVFFSKDEQVDIPDSLDEQAELFESYEQGAGKKLKEFAAISKEKYDIALSEFIYKPYNSFTELLNLKLLKNVFKLNVFGNYHKEVTKYFQNEKLLKLIEWEITFIGCSPYNAPGMYSLINHAGIEGGIWYPDGGMTSVIQGFYKLAKEQGVKFFFNHPAQKIITKDDKATGIKLEDGTEINADIVISNADYAFTEQVLLSSKNTNISDKNWQKMVMSPSTLLFFLGVNKEIPGLKHHNYFFDTQWQQHFIDVYDKPKWPDDPMMYICNPSKTDSNVAPNGSENLFVLIPIAPGLEDTEEIREKYFEYVINKLELYTGEEIKKNIVVKRSYAVKDFEKDYNAYKGNAFGIANTLFQTAIFRPGIKNKKINNLFYAGSGTNPGVGLPTSLISGQIVAEIIGGENV
ncbi:phytoene desaturase [Candidatus Dojkabacteria bacterium]|uniref:Phytoene desaturase n=1 Tax=Candidatus Dojkabacteria bacterium TaxID=2099670 RepID=A0A955RIU6_9BACT|nr:phytoene desaturase [Candidatus Dojkabacteria bacterium]